MYPTLVIWIGDTGPVMDLVSSFLMSFCWRRVGSGLLDKAGDSFYFLLNLVVAHSVEFEARHAGQAGIGKRQDR